MYNVDNDILKTILLEPNMNEDDHSWILDPISFRVIVFFYYHVQASIFVLINKFCTFIVATLASSP